MSMLLARFRETLERWRDPQWLATYEPTSQDIRLACAFGVFIGVLCVWLATVLTPPAQPVDLWPPPPLPPWERW